MSEATNDFTRGAAKDQGTIAWHYAFIRGHNTILSFNQYKSFAIWLLSKGDESVYVCSHERDLPSSLRCRYGSGIGIRHSSEGINVYGQGFPSHTANTVWAQTNRSYSSCPLMSFCKFILTWELKMKWKPTAFIIIVLSLPLPLFAQFLLHTGLIRFTSFLEQWFTFFHAHWDLFISTPYIKHVLRQEDAAKVACTPPPQQKLHRYSQCDNTK